MTKFTKNIKEIQDNEFFNFDYKDLVQNFDTNSELNNGDEKVQITAQLSLINVAFIDFIRGDISRPKFIDKILTIYRREFVNDVRYRLGRWMKIKKSKVFNIIEYTKDGKIKLKFDTSKEFIEKYDEITPFLVRKGETLEIKHIANDIKENVE